MPVWVAGKNLQVVEVRARHRQTRVSNVNLWAAAIAHAAGDLLYVADRGDALPNMRRWAWRRQAVNEHAAVNIRDFRLGWV